MQEGGGHFDQSPLLPLLTALVSMFCFALYIPVSIPNKVAMISVSISAFVSRDSSGTTYKCCPTRPINPQLPIPGTGFQA
jgi:hypothetical protein